MSLQIFFLWGGELCIQDVYLSVCLPVATTKQISKLSMDKRRSFSNGLSERPVCSSGVLVAIASELPLDLFQ